MKTSSGPESVRQHLHRFAIATIVAGVGLLAVAWPAEAEIIYTKVKVKIPANSSYNLDVNNDGVTDFIISTSYARTRGGGFSENFAETPASGNGAEGSPPARLIAIEIGPSQTFYGGTGTLVSLQESCFENGSCTYSASGNWLKQDSPEKYVGRSGYLGLSFQINGETYYGWVYLSVSLDEGNNPFVTLNGYAYETTPGMPIKAGQTTDGSSALSPGPANRDDSGLVASVTNPTQAVTLGTLEVGARDVPLLRRKEPAGQHPKTSSRT